MPVGVAVAATVVAALGLAQSAFAQDAPPPPPSAESTSTSATTPDPPPPADSPPADTNPSEPPPAATPPDSAQETTETTSTPSSTEPSTEKPADAPATETVATTTAPAEAEPASESKTDATAAAEAVKLESATPATASATTGGAPATPAAESAATPPSGAPPAATIVLQNTQIAAAAAPATTASPAPASSAAANAEAVAQVAAVSFRPRSVVALDYDEAPALEPASRASVVPVVAPLMSRSARQTCMQPHGLVPLSYKCKLVVRAPATRGSLAYVINAPSPEVRAAIDRGAARAAATRAKAALHPASEAAKERPIPKIRPILPFGGVALGALQEGVGGVAGSTWSSRMFALAGGAPLRVPRPFRLARLRLPTTIAHGVLAAPPPARPG